MYSLLTLQAISWAGFHSWVLLLNVFFLLLLFSVFFLPACCSLPRSIQRLRNCRRRIFVRVPCCHYRRSFYMQLQSRIERQLRVRSWSNFFFLYIYIFIIIYIFFYIFLCLRQIKGNSNFDSFQKLHRQLILNLTATVNILSLAFYFSLSHVQKKKKKKLIERI